MESDTKSMQNSTMNTSLKGFICVTEYRSWNVACQKQTHVLCRRFWDKDPIIVATDENNQCQYHEEFKITDMKFFLEQVERLHLCMELWQHKGEETSKRYLLRNMEALGVALLPMHPFYTAFHNKTNSDRIHETKQPVISIDDWVPVVDYDVDPYITLGEFKCLFAVGTEEQISLMITKKGINIKDSQPLRRTCAQDILPRLAPIRVPKEELYIREPIILKSNPKMPPLNPATLALINFTESLYDHGNRHKRFIELINEDEDEPEPTTSTPPDSSPSTNSIADTIDNPFHLMLEIKNASNLSVPAPSKTKRGAKRDQLAKRYSHNEVPSSYVSFEAGDPRLAHFQSFFKSFGNHPYSTRVVKNVNPRWNEKFHITLDTVFLKNLKKPFILEVWNKSVVPSSRRSLLRQSEDTLIGQVSIYLFPLANGDEEIYGSYPILDSAERNVGQLQLRCHLLYHKKEEVPKKALVDEITEQFAQTLDINKFDLGDAIECKFRELQAINERLKQRLSDVAGEPIFTTKSDPSALMRWQNLCIDGEDDDECQDLDDFESYINTTVLEPITEEEIKTNNVIEDINIDSTLENKNVTND